MVNIEKKLLNPMLDYVFKRIFGRVGNEEITKDLLGTIMKEKIEEIELDKNPILERDLLVDKLGILDIRTKVNKDTNINIEIQVVDKYNIEKRLLFYWSKLYSKSIRQGQDYNKLEKTVVILFSNYELENLKNIDKYITKWNIREEEYYRTILTNALEIYIIEMPKVKKNKQENKLDKWLKFIKNPGEIDMNEENKAIKKAKEVLEEISQDEHEQYLADLREKYILDRNSMLNGARKEGKEERY